MQLTGRHGGSGGVWGDALILLVLLQLILRLS